MQAGQSATIGRFHLLDELGRGGMGVVYRAYDAELGREVALKLLLTPPTSGPGDTRAERAWARFRREAEAMARVQHPNVVRIHEVGIHAGRPFLVLDFVAGAGTLEDMVSANGLPDPAEAARLIAHLARATATAHEAGVLHRDIKPANALIDEERRPFLTDFGLAKALLAWSDGTPSLTRTGQLAGTPGFWAPEQARGDLAQIGPWTDVYGLGATLYFLLSGQPPFLGSLHEILSRVGERPAPPSSLAPGVPRRLDEICLRALAAEPEARTPSALALAEELEAFAADPGAGSVSARRLAVVGIAGLVLTGATLALSLLGRPSADDGAPPAPSPSPTRGAQPSPSPEPTEVAALGEGSGAPPPALVPTLRPDDDSDAWIAADGSRLVLVPPGTFVMGVEPGGLLNREADDWVTEHYTPHQVTISRPFLLGLHEVTVAQFRRFCRETQRRRPKLRLPDMPWKDPRGPRRVDPNWPVYRVSYVDAQAYCEWAGLRLPTEAEWAWAARGEQANGFPWRHRLGSGRHGLTFPANLSQRMAENDGLTDDGYPFLAPVGTFPEGVSWCGALNMGGNVMEWTADWFGPYSAEAQVDPRGPAQGSPAHRVVRGGCWRFQLTSALAGRRRHVSPGQSNDLIGFRVAADLPE